MKPFELNTEFADSYFEFLKNLNPSIKLGLIEKLSKTLKKDLTNKSKSLKKSFGAWDSEKSANQIIEEIHQSRSFPNRKTEM